MIAHLLKLFWIRKRSNTMLILEIFISFIVLFVITLLSIIQLERFRKPIGFSIKDVYTVNLDFINRLDENETDSMVDNFVKCVSIIEELKRMPEVESVASVFPNPYGYAMSFTDLAYENRTVNGRFCSATDDVFQTLDVKLLKGRAFNESDDALDWSPIIINAQMEKELFQGEDPIGKELAGEGHSRVVGVIEDFRYSGEFSEVKPFFMKRRSLKIAETGMAILTLVVKTKPGTTSDIEERVVKMMRTITPGWSVSIKLLTEMRRSILTLAMVPFLIGGLIAGSLMIMVMLGMTGVFWQSVTARTHEIGLRRALGGSKAVVYKQLLWEIVILTTMGCLVPIIILIQLPLFDAIASVKVGHILLSILVSAVSMYVLAIICGLYPAWLGTRIQPSEALHYE